MSVHSANQLVLDFDPGLAERHDSLLACVRQCAYTHRRPLKSIAADMDMSQSDLSRKLSGNPDDSRRFTVDDLEEFVRATNDMTPILYLAEKYLADAETKRQAANEQLARMLPEVLALIKAAQA